MAIADLDQVDREAIRLEIRKVEAWIADMPLSVAAAELSRAAEREIADAADARAAAKIAVEQARDILMMDTELRRRLPRFRLELRTPVRAARQKSFAIEIREHIVELRRAIVYADQLSSPGVRDLVPQMLQSCERIIDLADAMVTEAADALAGAASRHSAKRYALDTKAHMPRVPIPKPRPKPKPARKSKR